MKLKFFIIIVFLTCSFNTINANASFYSGNDYKSKTAQEQYFYVAGVFDGMIMTLYSSPNKDEVNLAARIEAYTKEMTLGQIKAIVDKYMNDHPEVWHGAMATIVSNALLIQMPQIKD